MLATKSDSINPHWTLGAKDKGKFSLEVFKIKIFYKPELLEKVKLVTLYIFRLFPLCKW